nr:MAG TPA: hypothetical protein [Caudoviricetes sp.]
MPFWVLSPLFQSARLAFWRFVSAKRAEKPNVKGKNRNRRRSRAAFAAVCVTMLLSSGCTTCLNGDFCALYRPVYPDYEKDTPETIRRIDENNIVYLQCL